MDPLVPIPWTRIVEIAAYVESEHSARGDIDRETALRLARAVLQFQEQLTGGTFTPRPRSPSEPPPPR